MQHVERCAFCNVHRRRPSACCTRFGVEQTRDDSNRRVAVRHKAGEQPRRRGVRKKALLVLNMITCRSQYSYEAFLRPRKACFLCLTDELLRTVSCHLKTLQEITGCTLLLTSLARWYI